MSDDTPIGMTYEQFEAMVDDYIERSSRESGEMPASAFFALLFEKMAARAQGQETVRVYGHIVDGQLTLSAPLMEQEAVRVYGNEILVDRWRIIVSLQTA